MVWPELLTGDPQARMVGTFKSDWPCREASKQEVTASLVGLRVPYDLPLRRYSASELPWVAKANYPEPDWKGRIWTEGES